MPSASDSCRHYLLDPAHFDILEHKAGGFIARGTGCTITLFQRALSNTFYINRNNHKTNEVKNNAAIGVYRDRDGGRGSSWNTVLRSDGCSSY